MMKKLMIATGLASVLLLSACNGDDTPVTKDMKKEKIEVTTSEHVPNAQYKTDVEFDKALEEYEKALHKDGWKTIYDNKPSEIRVQKDDKVYRIHAITVNGETKIQKYEDVAPNETDENEDEEKTDKK